MSKRKRTDGAETDLLGAPIGEASLSGESSAKAAKSTEAKAQPNAPVETKRSYEPNPVVQEMPAACPRCGSTRSKVLKTTAFPHRPLHINGKTYPGRVTRRRMCDDCACRFVSNAPSQ